MQAIINELHIAVPMDTTSLAGLRWDAWAYLTASGVAPGMTEDILVALHEAVANALRHSRSANDVRVAIKATRTYVTVEVTDCGIGLDPGVPIPPRPPSVQSEGGRGLYMIWSLMSEVRVAVGSGTHLTMVKRLFPQT